MLAVLVSTREAGSGGRLGHGLACVVRLPGEAGRIVANVVLALTIGSRGGRLGRRGRLGSRAKTSEEMGAAGARRGRLDRVLGNGSHLGRRGDAQALERGTLATRSEAGGGHADAARLEVVVGHLSKTASVHAHVVLIVMRKSRTKAKAEQSDGRTGPPCKGYRIEESDAHENLRAATEGGLARAVVGGADGSGYGTGRKQEQPSRSWDD